MHFYVKAIFIIALFQTYFEYAVLENDYNVYSYSWIVLVRNGEQGAAKIAKNYHFEIKEKISSFSNLFHLSQMKEMSVSDSQNYQMTQTLKDDLNVIWTEQIMLTKIELKLYRKIMCPNPNKAEVLFRYGNLLNDKLFPKMWYLNDCRKSKASGNVIDINVVPVWHELHIFGYGIKVVVIDDGINTNHEDLQENYDKNYSWDFIENDDKPDPDLTIEDSHGTKCAGVIAMQADNNICGAGIAPFVTLGGIRVISNNDFNFVLNMYKALTFKMEDIHISNNSYGLPDDGENMDNMDPLINLALKQGISEGRQKKGVIYLFPSGNGKNFGDMCGADSFVNSIYTIVIGGVDHNGHISSTAERCSSVMAAAYSGDTEPFSIVSTNGSHSNICTDKFMGTSASTAIVSGAIALVLEANPNLTWREIQYILAWTCEVAPLQHNYDWYRNAAGFWVNHNFGFGMINVYNMVKLAKSFKSIPSMRTCVIKFHLNQSHIFTRLISLEIAAETDACKSKPSEINYIEHVQLQVNFMHPKRGNVEISLISPLGTVSRLLEPRFRDTFSGKVVDWTFDSIRTWGEVAQGKWTVIFSDNKSKYNAVGIVDKITLIIYGTKEKPILYEKLRTYYEFNILKEF